MGLLMGLIVGSSGMELAAQTQGTVSDSISIIRLMEQVEQATSYKIYTNISKPFMVKKQEGTASLEQLKEALSGTFWQVNVFGNRVFVMQNLNLRANLPKTWTDGTQDEHQGVRVTEVLTSENKVYEIGDKFRPSKAKKIKLTGQVIDFKTNSPAVGIHVIRRDPWTAATTDVDGRFEIELAPGYNVLELQGISVKDARRQLMLYADADVRIELEEQNLMLEEVLVTGGRVEAVKSTALGMEKITPSLLKNIPTAMGEVDVLKMVQALPGVKTVGEASSGFNVRGGSTDQNLMLLNGGTIYNPTHLFGFFTAFNSDMVSDVEIYKSSIPSQYGGRISSVLNITGKEANKEKFVGVAGIGLLTSKLNLEIPLWKERTSLLLSGRTTYSDWLLGMLPEKSGYKDGKAGFYDVGGTFSHTFNMRNKLNIYGYYSRDRFAFNDNEKYGYGNMNLSAHWRSIFNDRLTANFSVGYDHYDYKNDETVDSIQAARLSFGINQYFAKANFNLELEKHKLNFGASTLLYDIRSGKYEPLGEYSLVATDELQKDKALESAVYLGEEWEITPKFSVNAGIRYSMFNALGPRDYYTYQPGTLPSESTIADTVRVTGNKVLKTYHGPEFRLSGRYAFNDDFSVKAGFNTMRQYIHKVSNTSIMSPTDTWKLSDVNIKPQQGWQLAGGFYYNTPDRMWEFSLEGYYKKMKDYLDYRSGAKLLMNHHLETDVINTEGYAYGVELEVKKPKGKLNGWINYTYSRTFLRQNDARIVRPINGGDWYPTEYDKPHDFKFVGNYKFTRRYSLSLNMDYSTGRPTTVPAGQYYDQQLGTTQAFYTDRNSYRVPDYFRMDLSFNVEASHHLTLATHSSISFGVYNLTGRKNVYSIYYVVENKKIQGYKMSIFGAPIPFVTYNIKF
ncbi:MAG: TonB-dependent receptor plug domain-containing protein [Bacteroidaceae bacterium]|nr:TonB-dependent receptor plug domain-containing protein [Bacteroidaceae bacterium]